MALRDPQLPLGPGPGEPPPEPPPHLREPAPPPAYVSWTLLLGSVGWYLAQLALAAQARGPAPSVSLYGPDVYAGEWWRVLLWVFEHGGPVHLLFNMSAVWTLGRVLEAGVGPFRFAVTTLVSALGAALFVLLFNFGQHTVGASGAILGWAGAILPIATRHGRREISTWLVQVALISLLPGVSWAGHLGGFLFGLPCGWAMRGRDPARFHTAAPILVFVSAVLVYLAGSGRL